MRDRVLDRAESGAAPHVPKVNNVAKLPKWAADYKEKVRASNEAAFTLPEVRRNIEPLQFQHLTVPGSSLQIRGKSYSRPNGVVYDPEDHRLQMIMRARARSGEG